MTALATLLRDMIASEGPIPLERFMAIANGHPALGYYASRDPFGAAGDFTTAPEISQMFGELVGLWAAETWRACGAPSPVHLVELGPGRGTMMADALRALRVAPDFLAAAQIHLVEASPTLTTRQRETLAQVGNVQWHTTLESVPPGPAIVLANEFFDALPVRHFVRIAGAWRERLVGVGDDGAFVWGAAPDAETDLRIDAPDGALLEIAAVAQRVMTSLARRLVEQGGALLAIDYGHATTGLGETLQAVRRHRFVDPLETPGEADLTVHVDFAALARAAQATGAGVQGPVTQKTFLQQIGIRQRAAVLSKHATPDGAQKIATALNRLTAQDSPTAMGTLFKAVAVTQPDAPPLAGFITESEP